MANYICTLDFGSSKITAAVAKVGRKGLSDLQFTMMPSKGIEKGMIVDSAAFSNSVRAVLRNLCVKSGIKIRNIYTNISASNVIVKHSRAIIPLTERGNKVVTPSDVMRVNHQARVLGANLEEEIIHQIPFSYSIDSKEGVLNPLGLYSHKLESDMLLVCGRISFVQSLSRAVNQAGYELKGMALSGIAAAEVVFDPLMREGTSVFCDIGSDNTEMLIFRNGSLRHIEILPIGGDDITMELAKTVDIPAGLAEDIKITHAFAGDCSRIEEDKEVLIKRNNIYKPLKQRQICEVVTAKTREICTNIRRTLERTVTCGEVDNLIAGGRTISLDGFLETLETSLGVPVRQARILNPRIAAMLKNEDILSGQKYMAYITCFGLLCVAHSYEYPSDNGQSPAGTNVSGNWMRKASAKFKEIYEEYF